MHMLLNLGEFRQCSRHQQWASGVQDVVFVEEHSWDRPAHCRNPITILLRPHTVFNDEGELA